MAQEHQETGIVDALLEGPIEARLQALSLGGRVDAVALAACLLRIDEAGPILTTLLQQAASGKARLSEAEATLLFRGLHVLGGARYEPAFAPLLQLLGLTADVDRLLGDAITETLPRIIAGVFDGDAPALLAAIAESWRDEFVRDSLMGAATHLAWEGRIEREAMHRFLVRFDEERLAEDQDYAWYAWLMAIALLGFDDLAPRVRKAWLEDRIPPNVLSPSDFEDDLAAALRAPDDVERLTDANLGYLDDVYADLARWDLVDTETDESEDDRWAGAQVYEPRAPVINPFRHVGRNDPCPCGSGRKAKKCCLSAEAG